MANKCLSGNIGDQGIDILQAADKKSFVHILLIYKQLELLFEISHGNN